MSKESDINNAQWAKIEGKFFQLHPHAMLRFVVHVVEHCNLHCKGCGHFSPLAEEEYLDIEEYRKDCRRLSELFGGEAEKIDLIGGEPLLHPELPEIMRITREAFPVGKISILTNGVLFPSMEEEFWSSCRENRIHIVPTKYPIRVDYEKWQEYAQERGITYRLDGTSSKMSRLQLNLKGDSPVERTFYHCSQPNECIALRHGKLYTCVVAAYADHFKKYFHKDIHLSERDGVDIYAVENAEELMKKMTEPIPFCRYCSEDLFHYWEEWAPSRKNIYDWAAFTWNEEDIQYLKAAPAVYVYGAGSWGVVSRLRENGVAVQAVLTAHLEESPQTVAGVPVVGVTNLGEINPESVCLIAENDSAKIEPERIADRLGFEWVLRWPDLEEDEEAIKALARAPAVYVYGAGYIWQQAVTRLQAVGAKNTAVLVSDTKNNCDSLYGIPVKGIQEIQEAGLLCGKGSVCLIAMTQTARSEIAETVKRCGFKHLIPLFGEYLWS